MQVPSRYPNGLQVGQTSESCVPQIVFAETLIAGNIEPVVSPGVSSDDEIELPGDLWVCVPLSRGQQQILLTVNFNVQEILSLIHPWTYTTSQ